MMMMMKMMMMNRCEKDEMTVTGSCCSRFMLQRARNVTSF